MRLAGNTGRKKSPSAHHRTTLSGYLFATKARIDNRKKLVKQQYLSHMSSVGDDLNQMIYRSRFKSFPMTYDFDLNQFSSHDL